MTMRYFNKNVTFLLIITVEIIFQDIKKTYVTFSLIINFLLCNIFINFSQKSKKREKRYCKI